MTRWERPALGVVLGKLVELAMRAERVRAAEQSKAAARVLELATRNERP